PDGVAPGTARAIGRRDHRPGDGMRRGGHDPSVIRNAVIHIANEQPLLADLYDMPTSTDVSLVCTNIRMLDGKKPVFVDHQNSVFVFPYDTIRFLEIMAASATGLDTGDDALIPVGAGGNGANGAAGDAAEADDDLELDEDFLQRIREV